MSRKRKTVSDDDLLPEYDFTGAVRGKYYERYRQGTNIVLLDPDVAAAFKDSAAVNEALRLLVSIAKTKVHRPVQPTNRAVRSGKHRRPSAAARA